MSRAWSPKQRIRTAIFAGPDSIVMAAIRCRFLPALVADGHLLPMSLHLHGEVHLVDRLLRLRLRRSFDVRAEHLHGTALENVAIHEKVDRKTYALFFQVRLDLFGRQVRRSLVGVAKLEPSQCG